MFKLDDQFLEELGLGAMPRDDRPSFLMAVYEELEVRVGEVLTTGMSDTQLDEFGYFVDKDERAMARWIEQNRPDFLTDKLFLDIQANNPSSLLGDILSEYGAMAWLVENRPDYPEVVARVLDEVKSEISYARDTILAHPSS